MLPGRGRGRPRAQLRRQRREPCGLALCTARGGGWLVRVSIARSRQGSLGQGAWRMAHAFQIQLGLQGCKLPPSSALMLPARPPVLQASSQQCPSQLRMACRAVSASAGSYGLFVSGSRCWLVQGDFEVGLGARAKPSEHPLLGDGQGRCCPHLSLPSMMPAWESWALQCLSASSPADAASMEQGEKTSPLLPRHEITAFLPPAPALALKTQRPVETPDLPRGGSGQPSGPGTGPGLPSKAPQSSFHIPPAAQAKLNTSHQAPWLFSIAQTPPACPGAGRGPVHPQRCWLGGCKASLACGTRRLATTTWGPGRLVPVSPLCALSCPSGPMAWAHAEQAGGVFHRATLKHGTASRAPLGRGSREARSSLGPWQLQRPVLRPAEPHVSSEGCNINTWQHDASRACG